MLLKQVITYEDLLDLDDDNYSLLKNYFAVNAYIKTTFDEIEHLLNHNICYDLPVATIIMTILKNMEHILLELYQEQDILSYFSFYLDKQTDHIQDTKEKIMESFRLLLNF